MIGAVELMLSGSATRMSIIGDTRIIKQNQGCSDGGGGGGGGNDKRGFLYIESLAFIAICS